MLQKQMFRLSLGHHSLYTGWETVTRHNHLLGLGKWPLTEATMPPT